MTTTVTLPQPSRLRWISNLWPVAFAIVMLLLLFVVPIAGGRSVTVFSLYNALQSFAGLGLIALALGLTMIIGEFDLSVVGTWALGGMIAVKLGGQNPLIGALAALIVCGLLGLLQGFIVSRFSLNSMAVTLAGYLVALGATGIIGDNKSQPYANFGITAAMNSPVAGVFSVRSLVAITVFIVVGLLFVLTRMGRDLRATGGGRRASRTAGVRVNAIVTLTFAASGALAALGGTLQSLGVATASSSPGLSPLIFGVTASLLGGIALSGGKGSPLGIAAGALALCLLSQLFTDLASPQYMASLITGALLIILTVTTTPIAGRLWKKLRLQIQRRADASPFIQTSKGQA